MWFFFGDVEIETLKIFHKKNSVFKKDVDIDYILISNKFFYGEKNYE